MCPLVVIGFPVWLLWGIRITLRKKIALGGIFSLVGFTIVATILSKTPTSLSRLVKCCKFDLPHEALPRFHPKQETLTISGTFHVVALNNAWRKRASTMLPTNPTANLPWLVLIRCIVQEALSYPKSSHQQQLARLSTSPGSGSGFTLNSVLVSPRPYSLPPFATI